MTACIATTISKTLLAFAFACAACMSLVGCGEASDEELCAVDGERCAPSSAEDNRAFCRQSLANDECGGVSREYFECAAESETPACGKAGAGEPCSEEYRAMLECLLGG